MTTTITSIAGDCHVFKPRVHEVFSSAAKISWSTYEVLRPRYPDGLFDVMRRYMQVHNNNVDSDKKSAMDYGSGTGIVVPRLLDDLAIHTVLATDKNERQLRQGRQTLLARYGSERFNSMVGAAGELHTVPDGSVDLVTAGEAMHWFDQRKWFAEVARVLKPSGTLAIWFYPPQPVVLSNDDAMRAWDEAFRRILDIGIPKGGLSIDQVLCSQTLQDNIVMDSSMFSQQERHKWLLPNGIHDRVDRCADFAMNNDPYTEDQARAGLLAVPETKVYEVTPATADEVFLRSTGWTTTHLVNYLGTMTIDTEIQDSEFLESMRRVEDAVGGPMGTFDVGWSLVLMLATRK